MKEMFYTNNYVTDIPADLSSEEAKNYDNSILTFHEEAVYVYSFVDFKMVYARGWENVLGYRDDEISLLKIFKATTPRFHPFSSDLNEKAMKFILNEEKDVDQYSFMIELEKFHKNGHVLPMIVRVGVLSHDNGRVTRVIGRFQVNRSIRLGAIMKYAAYGPNKSNFEDTLNAELFKHMAISKKELEAIQLAANGLTLKEIASELGISHSAVEKRILPLYQKFNVKSLTHLIKFCYENQLLVD